MLRELLKEESEAIEDFYKSLAIGEDNKIIDESESAEKAAGYYRKLFEEAAERSQKALQECQLIESLDQRLRRLTETVSGLKKAKKLEELEGRLLKELNLSLLIPMVSEWRSLTCEGSVGGGGGGTAVATFVNETLPNILDKEIDSILLAWIDDPPRSIDPESLKIIEPFLAANPSNPLPVLFTSFPLSKLGTLLKYHEQLGNLPRVKKGYPDRLLRRFYDILSDGPAPAPFSVGLIESLVSEKMKFATRISCILEATSYFSKLHEGVIDIGDILGEKGGQILRQIRRDAKKERNGYTGDSAVMTTAATPTATAASSASFAFDALSALAAFSFTPSSPPANHRPSAAVPPSNNLAQIDCQLNEICLIITSLSRQSPRFGEELEKWKLIHSQLEEVYLYKGIRRAIEMDQIVVTADFPVSSCVDDIFYILKASQQRTNGQGYLDFLIPRALKEFFLNVLRKHLESTVQALKPLQNLEAAPSRDLISTLVLLNNLVTVKSYWRQGFGPNGGIHEELDSLFKLALQDGLYGKVLRKDVVLKASAGNDGEEMFVKIHAVLDGIFNLFKVLF